MDGVENLKRLLVGQVFALDLAVFVQLTGTCVYSPEALIAAGPAVTLPGIVAFISTRGVLFAGKSVLVFVSLQPPHTQGGTPRSPRNVA